MFPNAKVSREPYLTAPGAVAVYAQNPSYASPTGLGLVESVKHEALALDAQGNKVYYHPKMWRRFSGDNGKTWVDGPIQATETAERLAGTRRNVSLHTVDARRGALIALHCTYDVDMGQEMFAVGNLRKRTYRAWYELSFDAGRTWTAAKQVIDERPGHDAVRWAPGLQHGCNGGSTDLSMPVWLADGSVLFGLTLTHEPLPGEDFRRLDRGGRMGVGYLRGRWDASGEDLVWRMGGHVVLREDQSPSGCCEPTAAALGDGRLFNVMRCQGDAARGIPSRRFATLSRDGGETWSEPEPLRYDDGEVVWSPASLSTFIRSSRTGEWYWLANILPGPVPHQTPRYPLCVARLDAATCRIVRGSARVIQDRPAGMHAEVRYTNWGCYEDRVTGELVLTLPEQPRRMDFTAMRRSEDFDADCLRYRVRLE